MKRSAYTYETSPAEVTIVGLDTPPDPSDPLYDPGRTEREIPADEVQTAFDHGVPGVVEVVKRKGQPLPVVVSGRQRTKALRLANALRVEQGLGPHPLRVLLVDGNALHERVILENSLTTPLTPLQKAQHAKRLKDEGKTAGEVASLFGVSDQAVRDWLILTEVGPKVLAAVEAGKISAYDAVGIGRKAKGDPEVEAERLAKALEGKVRAPREPGASETPETPKKNMNKALAREMAKETAEELPEGAEILDEGFLLGLRFAAGLASMAECARDVRGFKAARARARKRL